MAQNNQALFDALMAGGCGGILERWITSPNSNDYSTLIDAVEAFATAVDAAIPTIGGNGPSLSQINLLLAIAQGVVAGRNLTSINADTFADIAAAIAAAFSQCSPRLNNVPVINAAATLKSIGADISSVDIAPGNSGTTSYQALAGTFPYKSNETFVIVATLQFTGTVVAAYIDVSAQLQVSGDGSANWVDIGAPRKISQVVDHDPTFFSVTCTGVALAGDATEALRIRMRITNEIISGGSISNIDVALSAQSSQTSI